MSMGGPWQFSGEDLTFSPSTTTQNKRCIYCWSYPN